MRNPPHVCFDHHPKAQLMMAHADRMALITSKMWAPGDKLSVSFIGGTPTQRANVAAVATELMKWANVTFDFVAGATAGMIRIAFNPSLGAWSTIGRDALTVPKSQQTMNLGFDQPGTYLHEFCHTLGAIHEHQTPFNNPIKWNKPQVYHDLEGPPNNWDQAAVDHNMFETYNQASLNGTAFDKQSIMLYAFPASWTVDGFHVEPNAVLSDLDRQWLSTKYPGRMTPPLPPPVVPPDYDYVILKPGKYRVPSG